MVGRWYGVRGRRFVRPALILSRGEGTGETRALADLDHKPWAADDGAQWLAEFPVQMGLKEATSIELSVAPDITVALARPGAGTVAAGRRIIATGSPGSTTSKATAVGSGRRRPATLGAGGGDAGRVTARMAAAGDALKRERDRRGAAERALEGERERRAGSERVLEEERAEGRRMRIEMGQLRAELELARAGQAEGSEAAAELETARQELLAVQRRNDEVVRERDRVARAHAEVRTALHERTGALESARQALAAEQADSSRLRDRLARAPARPPGGPSSAAPPRGDPPAAGRQERAGDGAAADGDSEPDPAPVESIGRRASSRGADPPGPHGSAVPGPVASGYHLPPASAAMRRRNPWIGRALALLFLIAVVVAIVLLIQSTVA